jgi:hypothetical protein
MRCVVVGIMFIMQRRGMTWHLKRWHGRLITLNITDTRRR